MASEITSRGELSRIAILQSAYDLFTSQGYHGTSMRQIAEKSEIALGGLYNHYDSKEQIFKAVFVEFHPLYEVLPALSAAQGDKIEQLVHDTLERMLAALDVRPNFMNLMFIEVVEFKSAHMGELFSEFLPSLIELIEQLKQKDRERLRNIPTLMLLRAFMGMFFGYYLSEIILAPNTPAEFSENAPDYFVEIFLHGTLKDCA